jgi:hypothetical protein
VISPFLSSSSEATPPLSLLAPSYFMDFPGLCFSPDIGVQLAVWHRFGEPINFAPLDGPKEFFLVASVG